ncbi:probable E3 ubiquitin-protein ligase RHY1A [Ananas comosus]|uniref:Probable E3 ubiquitin-protein ligase RHY1A n=1 Tax=Ananas comosus TaxID=4615 RepID=A0A6P5GAC2_ANACO|nr:probable E3 ubiquitin-protein ligase RHY1A [Ananas comosus]
MMLPGVELARRRRLHHHHSADPLPAAASAPGGGGAAAASSMAEPALAARIRLEEKLHGLSRWSRLPCNNRGDQNSRPAAPGPSRRATAELPARNPGVVGGGARPVARTSSRTSEVCAVCLEEVEVEAAEQTRVTRLPCSHRYHSDCVLPWLAAHPDCPCCRASVVPPPSLHVPS